MTQTLTTRRHTELVDQMADTLGVDLEEAVYAGRLDPETLCDAVLRCTGCSDPEGCAKWMAAQDAPVEAPPIMCRNGEMFVELKGALRL